MKNSGRNDLRAFVALLRGINVGGNKKVPMADLKKTFEKMGFKNIRTILNTGNVLFDATSGNIEELASGIAAGLEKAFGLSVPVIVRSFDDIGKVIKAEPFSKVKITPDTRLYVTFLPGKPKSRLVVPYASPDGSFEIISLANDTIFSVLDLSRSQTTDAMNILEKEYGRNITTRNWNTVKKIANA